MHDQVRQIAFLFIKSVQKKEQLATWLTDDRLIYSHTNLFFSIKGHVKLMQRVKIAHSFLHSVSNQFHIIILSLPVLLCKWLSNNFSKLTFKNGEIGCFNRSLLIEPF